jgi:hypothetical protein
MVNYRALLTFCCQRTSFISARCPESSSEGFGQKRPLKAPYLGFCLSFATRSQASQISAKIYLELIEVQTGSYLGEDDIVRFEDDYIDRSL